jgi:hypothetical protein
MADRQHMARLKKGVAAWNRWRLRDVVRPNLAGAKLKRSNLRQIDLSQADMRGAELADADLSFANLSSELLPTDLTDASLAGANLGRADLTGAKLSGSNLTNAYLVGTNFTGADLSGVYLGEATVGWTIFAGLDLRSINGLDSVHHQGPSYISVETLVRSRGKVPEGFLSRCGFPEQLLAHLPMLFNESLEFNSCFISYSSVDQAFAERLHGDLQENGVRCWFAPHDVRGGRKLHEQLDEAIHLYDRLLLILSEDSMNSEWVKTEIAHARQKELNERRQVLFPIGLVPFSRIRGWKCFDADTGKDSAREIREYFIPDFSKWKTQDAYDEAFKRLVKDLKVQDKAISDPSGGARP